MKNKRQAGNELIRRLLRRVRKNHALEHGAVTLMIERGVRPPMGGYSTPGGFFLFTKAPLELVSACVTTAYARMSAGDRDLAISPYCGTNLATGFLMGVLVVNIIMGRRKKRIKRLPLAFVAFAGCIAASRPIGNALQRKFTTLADIQDGEVLGIKSFSIGAMNVYRVSTRYSD